MRRLIMRIDQDQIADDEIDHTWYVKTLLRFFNNNIARGKIDKRWLCDLGLW